MKKMDLTLEEPLFSLQQDPMGSNNNKSYSSFYQKKLYELKSFKQPLFTDNKPINVLYDKMFYGRVNLNNDSVIVDRSKLISKISANGTEIKLMNFVFDAYRDFISYWDYLKKINKLNKNSVLYDIKATTSWIDPAKMYYYYMSGIFDQIKQQINIKNITIKNFNDFIKEFIDYTDATTPIIPITFSNFVRSRMADPFISGMCFDVNQLDLTDDGVKYSQVLQDPNYPIFKKTAMKFGFFPDKHVPWRLYADIDSIAMKPYMDKYFLTQDNLYNINYVSADLHDLELLRFYMIQFYNTYILGKPEYKETTFSICKKNGNTKVENRIHKLERISLEKAKLDIDFDRLFMKLYVFLKARENNLGWDQAKFENTVQKFIDIKEGLDTTLAMRYITPLFRASVISDHRQRNFKL